MLKPSESESARFRILIMGAGALGSVVGGLMAKAGHGVTLIGRKPHMDRVAACGLRVTGIWGEHEVAELDCRTDTAGLERGAFDFIIVTVKSYATEEAGAAVAPLVDDDTLVCSYQNGLGNVEILASHVGWEHAFGARAIYGARIVEAGHVDVTVIAQPTALGTYEASTPVGPVKALVSAMDEAGLPTVYTESISTVLWSKVAYNCALNPMSALLDVPYGVVAGNADSRAVIEEVIHELYAVGYSMKIPLEPATPERYLAHFFEDLIPPTAEHYASMREDFLNRRRTEIEALNGAICRYGEEHGIPTPVNQTLSRLVRAKEAEYLK